MDDEVLERVARAICKAHGVNPDAEYGCSYDTVVGYREGSAPASKRVVLTMPVWKTYECVARAAIDVLLSDKVI